MLRTNPSSILLRRADIASFDRLKEEEMAAQAAQNQSLSVKGKGNPAAPPPTPADSTLAPSKKRQPLSSITPSDK
ncbi:hypothetical protein EMPS_05107 [Entomortierella parvispora]|uniref:Uncharacterized protein n=1 Tax=Entomortierella parvispora TaxID=205924 RepID=A0A9P3H9Q0_9FUNG|nr:hypothetical protein EMPS_05107 [Entomortierella parvispora]